MDLHFQATALLAIQEAMEAWLVRLMEDMNLVQFMQSVLLSSQEI